MLFVSTCAVPARPLPATGFYFSSPGAADSRGASLVLAGCAESPAWQYSGNPTVETAREAPTAGQFQAGQTRIDDSAQGCGADSGLPKAGRAWEQVTAQAQVDDPLRRSGTENMLGEAGRAWERLVASAQVDDPLRRPGTGLVAFASFGFAAAPPVFAVPRWVFGADAAGAWLTVAYSADVPRPDLVDFMRREAEAWCVNSQMPLMNPTNLSNATAAESARPPAPNRGNAVNPAKTKVSGGASRSLMNPACPPESKKVSAGAFLEYSVSAASGGEFEKTDEPVSPAPVMAAATEPIPVRPPENPGREQFEANVREAVSAIQAGQARKIVVARRVSFPLIKPAPVAETAARLVAALSAKYRDCWVFSVGGLVGATPEMLLEARDLQDGDLPDTPILPGDSEPGTEETSQQVARPLSGHDSAPGTGETRLVSGTAAAERDGDARQITGGSLVAHARVLAGTARPGEGIDLMKSAKNRAEHALAVASVVEPLRVLVSGESANPDNPVSSAEETAGFHQSGILGVGLGEAVTNGGKNGGGLHYVNRGRLFFPPFVPKPAPAPHESEVTRYESGATTAEAVRTGEPKTPDNPVSSAEETAGFHQSGILGVESGVAVTNGGKNGGGLHYVNRGRLFFPPFVPKPAPAPHESEVTRYEPGATAAEAVRTSEPKTPGTNPAAVPENPARGGNLANLAPVLAPGVEAVQTRGPYLLELPNLAHLATDVTVPIPPGLSVFDLVGAIHPTAAVAGLPRGVALDFIRCHEEDRGRYAGPVGWIDAQGSGQFALALRCAQVGERALTAWAGAGIMADSDPETEFLETEAKLAPIRDCLCVH